MISGIVTVLLLVLFVAGWYWVWQPARAKEFAAAAKLPLEDDSGDPR